MTTSVAAMAEEFLTYDESLILQQIGQRTEIAAEHPAAATVAPAALKVDYPHLGFGDDVLELGKRVAKRLLRELHNVLCGNEADDVDDRNKLKAAFGLSEQAVAAAVAAVLAGPLGIGGAIAAAIAALFVKRLLGPTLEETCEFWDEKMAGM